MYELHLTTKNEIIKKMKIVIFGASGKTGKILMDMALEAGHEVCAYVRRPSAVQSENTNLSVVVGALSDTEKIRTVVAGADACISVLGGNSLKEHATEFMEGVRNIVSVMEQENVNRFIYMSSIGAGDSRYLMAQPARFIIVNLLLRIPLADHTTNEQFISQSALNYTVVRPGGLTDGPLVREVKHGTDKVAIKGSPSVSRASVAAFIIKELSDTIYSRKAVWLYA